MSVEKMLGALVPPSDDTGVVRWRWIMAISVGTLMLWAAWAMGLFAGVGFPGFARADETEKLDMRLAQIEQKQDITAKLALAAEVCRIYYLRMTAEGQLRVQLNNSFEEKQEQYSAIAGQRYSVAECTPPG
jgi:hypothetical protein